MTHLTPNSFEAGELVVNWHVTEACNYRCQYCYAHWDAKETRSEIWKSHTRSVELLQELYRFFSPENEANPLRQYLTWRSVRLSIAGGEPTLLGKRLSAIVNHAREIGFRVSIITNATRPDAITEIAAKIDMLGISIDSDTAAVNSAIGRESLRGTQISRLDVLNLVEQVRSLNPAITIKLNTVVSAKNIREDMSRLITAIAPDRWKIMRMLPITTQRLSINNEEFQQFVLRHHELSVPMTIENNDDMDRSYVMVDPTGRFFQNEASSAGYKYSDNILAVGAVQAFRQTAFCPATYFKRYNDLKC